MKVFHLKIALGLALGESWPLLAQPQKNIGVPCLPSAYFRGRDFLGIPYSSPPVAKLNKSVWSETRMLSSIG